MSGRTSGGCMCEFHDYRESTLMMSKCSVVCLQTRPSFPSDVVFVIVVLTPTSRSSEGYASPTFCSVTSQDMVHFFAF